MLDGILFNVGFVSSTRVIVCWQLAVRLLSFGLVATHVLTFVVSPQLCAGTVMLSLYVIVAAAQPAVEVEVAEPVTVGLVLVPGHAVKFAGHEIDGGVSQTQFTVTVNEAVFVLPQLSVAVYTTVVTPAAKVLPLVCVEMSVGLPQLSAAVGVVHVAVA